MSRILTKGCFFDQLNQNDVDIVLSHMNSYIRTKYDNIPVISKFSSIFGKDCLDILNLRIIPADEVILDTKLLKGKI